MLAALFSLESTARAWDAHAELQSAERAVRLGEPYYVAGTDQKGPLWLAFYDVAYRLGGTSSAWFVIAALAILLAVGTALAVRRIALSAGASPLYATVAAAALAIYLTLGNEEFSRVLYSRNIVAFLNALAFALLLSIDWRRPRAALVSSVLAGAAVGLGMQTNLSSAPTALTALALLAVLARRAPVPPRGRRGWVVAPLAFAVTAAVALVSAHAWYLARGAFDDFWDQWWTYNRHYAEATGRSLPGMLWQGVLDFAGWYKARPEQALVVAAFAGHTFVRARHREPVALELALLAWWLAECLSVALSQRFFDHYLILPTIPTAAMGAVLLGRLARQVSPAIARLAAALLLAGTLVVLASPRFSDGLEDAAHFRGFGTRAQSYVEALPAERRALRGLVDRLSNPGDYVYIWLREPLLYTQLERTSATRYIENRWLTGEIYGAPFRGYTVPHAWANWRADMRRTPPLLVVEEVEMPIPSDSPAGRMVRCGYSLVHDDDAYRVYRRRAGRSPSACTSDPGSV